MPDQNPTAQDVGRIVDSCREAAAQISPAIELVQDVLRNSTEPELEGEIVADAIGSLVEMLTELAPHQLLVIDAIDQAHQDAIASFQAAHAQEADTFRQERDDLIEKLELADKEADQLQRQLHQATAAGQNPIGQTERAHEVLGLLGRIREAAHDAAALVSLDLSAGDPQDPSPKS